MLQKTVLENGLTVLTYAMPYAWSAAVGIWVGTGSCYENSNNNGVSHFIEHLLFKGTKNRTAKQIVDELEALGGQLNAFTSKEHTCYYAKVLSEHLPVAIDVLSDMVINSRFDPAELERERSVVIEEIKMYEDTPEELVFDLIENKMWGDHSIGWPISGIAETVAGLSRSAILDYYHHYYVPENMVVAVAGKIDHAAVVHEIERHFASLNANGLTITNVNPVYKGGVDVRGKDIEQVHLCLGLPAYSLKHPQYYAMQVLNNIMGGGMSSRLFQEIREKRGLAYSVYSNFSAYKNNGIYAVYAATSGHNGKEVVDVVFNQLLEAQTQGFTPDEFRRAKESLKGSLLLSLEGTSSQMLRIGKSQLSFGKVIVPEEIIAKIDAITPEDVHAAA